MEGGLFTQLMAKKVLNQRTINNIKMKRTPEEQAEELLNFLPKKDCFDKLCEALEADDQEELVAKYLKTPLKSERKTSETKESSTSKCSSPIQQPSSETTDSGRIQSSDTNSTISVISLKEPDNNHLCIEYQNPPQSPTKRRRLEEISNDTQDYDNLDNTRYVHKHFISQESGDLINSDKSLTVVPVFNPQNVLVNPNIQDPARFLAAYGKKLSDFTSHLSDPNRCSSTKINIPSSQPTKCSKPLGAPLHPHQFLRQEGLLPPHKHGHPNSADVTQVDGTLPDSMGSSVAHANPSRLTPDMENLDLPDGCVNVKVEHSSRQFFINNYKKSYPMRRIPRGLFLIINVDEVEGKPPRKGTNFDRK